MPIGKSQFPPEPCILGQNVQEQKLFRIQFYPWSDIFKAIPLRIRRMLTPFRPKSPLHPKRNIIKLLLHYLSDFQKYDIPRIVIIIIIQEKTPCVYVYIIFVRYPSNRFNISKLHRYSILPSFLTARVH